MANASAGNGSSSGKATLLDRLVASVRQEATRITGRIRESLPPVVIEHRLEALEQHVDERLRGLEGKLDEILGALEKRRPAARARAAGQAKSALRASAK